MNVLAYLRPFGAIAAILAIACPIHRADAQNEEAPPLSVDAAVTLVSDYRFRGLSLSDHDPALQAELWLTHSSGIYAGVWGSTLAEYGGATVETDLAIGFTKPFGPFDLDVYATWYLYPGGADVDYIEVTSTVSTNLGPATLGAELAYAPSQPNTGNLDNVYGALHLSVPFGSLPLTAEGSIGLEDGAFGDEKLDWSLALKAEVKGLELAASYIDAAHHGGDALADPTVVLSVKKAF